MTETEAREEARRRDAESAEAGFWTARRTDAEGDEWQLVRVSGEGLARPRPSGAHVESKPKPPAPDDPRPALFRNVPPYAG
jgi:hypothetical protein